MFIGGTISIFISQFSAVKYFGDKSNKYLGFLIALITGFLLTLCSCSVVPLFKEIYKKGISLSTATVFLYSGPAINIVSIILIIRVFGIEMGIAKITGVIILSIIIGITMNLIFNKEEKLYSELFNLFAVLYLTEPEENTKSIESPDPVLRRPIWQYFIYLGIMLFMFILINMDEPDDLMDLVGILYLYRWNIFSLLGIFFAAFFAIWFPQQKWKVLFTCMLISVVNVFFEVPEFTGYVIGVVAIILITATSRDTSRKWFDSTFNLAMDIVPILIAGIFITGILLGDGMNKGIIPINWLIQIFGNNSFVGNFLASVMFSLAYIVSFTEIPIVYGLLRDGLDKGTGLTILLTAPAISLPSMIILSKIISWKKLVTYILMIVIFATITGTVYGIYF